MKHSLFSSSILFLILIPLTGNTPANNNEKEAAPLTEFVNPFIGTGPAKAGNTYPGAVVPFGMVSLSPHNDLGRPAGYAYGGSHISGFGHLHLNGVGCPDLGNIVIMPTTGAVKPGHQNYKSKYSAEQASPGFYQVQLDSYNIKAELSATLRTGISRFTFPSSKESNILIDAGQSLTPAVAAHVKIVSSTEVEGWNRSGNFCDAKNKQTVYFVARFSKAAKKYGVWREGKLVNSLQASAPDAGAWLTFSNTEGEAIEVKVGVSYVSIANARLNLEQEQKGFEFNEVKEAAKVSWETELSRIKVSGGTKKQKTIFYTALYHMLLHPNVLNDVNGEYPSMGPKRETLKAEGYTRYTVYSLWDTYRTVHPFFALVYPERQLDMVKTMVEMYKEYSWLPKWELASNETWIMVGDPALPVIADTYLKGLKGFDAELAFEAMVKGANTATSQNKLRPGLEQYLQYGYIPQNDRGGWLWGTVSTTQEYAYADWTLSQMAKAMGKEDEHKEYLRRSMFYKNLLDPATGYIRAKNKDGSWVEPFDPLTLEGGDFSFPGAGGPGYVEGNAWHYNFFVPHDPVGLAELLGGKKAFVDRLQKCFDENHYVLWNEPDMAYPFLFDYFEGEGWRTQKEVRAQLEKHFDIHEEGLPGNDDCGTISGFYLYAAMGFYPACPGSNLYQVCSPVFDRIEIAIDPKYYPGKAFVIETINNSSGNTYIQSAVLNGENVNMQQISHENLVRGGTLKLEMGAKPFIGK